MNRKSVLALTFGLGALLTPLVTIPAAAATTDVTSCGRSGTFHDLNGDGYVDAVVGDPYATVGGAVEAGTVTVLFGGADGRIGEGERRVLTQLDLGESPETGDHFGWSVSIYSTWDIDGSCIGLMIGAPGEDVDGHEDAGMAHIYGPVGGEVVRLAAISVDQSEVGGTVESGDEFGFSVAATEACDADHENYCSAAFHFGAPGENDDAGVVNEGNLVGWGRQLRQGFGGLPGRMQAGDRFGEVIGSQRYLPEDWDIASLYIGAPGDVVGGKRGAGSVTVSAPSPRLITQNTSGVPGVAETGDHFGASMASGDGAFRQLAIGSPGENVGSVVDAGSVTVLKRAGETIYPATVLTQATKGVSGTVERGDQFGAAVAYRDDRTLAIGVPREDVGTVVDAGSVQIVRVGKSNLSFPSPTITENSPGTPGVIEAGSRFGSTVTGVPGRDSEAIFAISSPFQDGGSVYVISNRVTIKPRFWKPGTGTIPGTGFRFGQSVA